jgi:ribosomal protein S17
LELSSQTSKRTDFVLQNRRRSVGQQHKRARLKKAIRHRKNSLFFQTQNGAQVGDTLMSIMETAQLNSLSPVRYLQTLLENWKTLHSEPESWLPWAARFQG